MNELTECFLYAKRRNSVTGRYFKVNKLDFFFIPTLTACLTSSIVTYLTNIKTAILLKDSVDVHWLGNIIVSSVSELYFSRIYLILKTFELKKYTTFLS